MVTLSQWAPWRRMGNWKLPPLVLELRTRWRLVVWFMPPAALTRKKKNFRWILNERRFGQRRRYWYFGEEESIFICPFIKLRNTVRSLRNSSENSEQDFYPAIRIVSRRGMCVTPMMNSMAVKGPSSMNKPPEEASCESIDPPTRFHSNKFLLMLSVRTIWWRCGMKRNILSQISYELEGNFLY